MWRFSYPFSLDVLIKFVDPNPKHMAYRFEINNQSLKLNWLVHSVVFQNFSIFFIFDGNIREAFHQFSLNFCNKLSKIIVPRFLVSKPNRNIHDHKTFSFFSLFETFWSTLTLKNSTRDLRTLTCDLNSH